MSSPSTALGAASAGTAGGRLSGLMPEFAAGLVVLLWSSTFLVSKDAFDVFEPLAYTGIRFICMVILALVVWRVRGRSNPERYFSIDRADLKFFIVNGVLGYFLYQAGFTLGLDRSSPFAAALIMALPPIFSLALATIQGERSPWITWFGAAVALAGVAVFLSDRDAGISLAGTLLMLGAAVSIATYNVLNRPLVRKYPFETVALLTTLSGAIPLVLISIPSMVEQNWSAPQLHHWIGLAYMVVLPVYIAYILWNWVIQQRGLAFTAAVNLIPIVSGIFSWIWFDEQFGALKIAGGVIALMGLLLMRKTPRTRS